MVDVRLLYPSDPAVAGSASDSKTRIWQRTHNIVPKRSRSRGIRKPQRAGAVAFGGPILGLRRGETVRMWGAINMDARGRVFDNLFSERLRADGEVLRGGVSEGLRRPSAGSRRAGGVFPVLQRGEATPGVGLPYTGGGDGGRRGGEGRRAATRPVAAK